MSSGYDKGNPTALIKSQLQLLRSEREKTISDIYSLEEEKKSIQKILPKVYYELCQLHKSIDAKNKEMTVFENAIDDIEKNYAGFLYTPNIFEDN